MKGTELKTINPATEEVINTFEIMNKEQINDKVKKVQNELVGSPSPLRIVMIKLHEVMRWHFTFGR